jgi:multiple sugar transport system permease protein
MIKAKKILIYIVLAVIAVFMVFPVIATLVDSFMPDWEVAQYNDSNSTDKSIKLIPSEFTFDQYQEVLVNNPKYWDYFWNSILLTVPTVIGQIIVSAMAAYFFTVMKSKYKEWLFFGYIIVMLLPYQATLVPAYLSLDTLGLINTRAAVILPGIFTTFGVFLLRQHMEQIPKSYFEAANMDGAGHWRTFLNVAVPSCKTGIVSLAILSFVDNWNMVEQPLIFLKDQSMQPLSLLLYDINSQVITIAFAASVLYMIPIILVFLNGEKDLMKGIKLSGIK